MSDGGSDVLTMSCASESDRFGCAARARSFAFAAGLSSRAAEEVALTVAELVSNVGRHADHGWLTLRTLDVPRHGVEVVCHDRGPGIADPERARIDGYSRGRKLEPDDRRHEGLGTGLGAMARMMDELEIHSAPGRGTTIVARKYVP